MLLSLQGGNAASCLQSARFGVHLREFSQSTMCQIKIRASLPYKDLQFKDPTAYVCAYEVLILKVF